MNMKSYNRREFLKGTFGLGAAGMLTCMTGIGVSAEEKGEAVYTPGTYTSEAHGHSSNVVVSVTFSETSIVDVRIDASGETENIGGLAVPILTNQIMKAQSSAIDGACQPGAGRTWTRDRHHREEPGRRISPHQRFKGRGSLLRRIPAE